MARLMKDSGIEWIGDIPDTWNTCRHKHVMHKEKNICDHYNGEDIISLTMNGVIIRDLDAGGKMPTTFDGYQYVEPEDLLLCLFDIDVTPRCVGLVRNYGLTSPAYSRFKVHNGFYNAYYDYLLRAIDDKKVFVHLAKNLRSSLTESDFGVLPTIAPPFKEQKSIVSFLDTECSRIDSVVEQTRASIEEYKKLKQAVITQAVTKGIKPNREMKDSGIEWVGEINTSFTCRKLKTFTDVISKGATPKDISKEIDEHYCIRFLKSENIVDNQLKKLPEFGITSIIHETELKRSQLREDDILFVIAGASIGKTAIMKSSFIPANTNQATCFIRIKSDYKAFQKYIWFVLQSDLVKKYISLYAVQSAQPNLSMENLGEMRIPYPNDYDELITITKYLDETSLRIDNLINNKLKLLCELEAYKKSLIFEYVTGKKEVIS